MTTSDAARALLLAEGLGACARIAVESEVGERAYLDLARALYRKIAGVDRGGRPRASHGPWDELLEALGTQANACDELRVSRPTLNRWLRRESEPNKEQRARIARIAQIYKARDPYASL